MFSEVQFADLPTGKDECGAQFVVRTFQFADSLGLINHNLFTANGLPFHNGVR
ncbi:MAG: hypothetical protein WB992_05735 [Bryobacteraceae bacterium]